MKIQVLGMGCPKCTKLAEAVEAAVTDLGLDSLVEKVTDLNEMVRMGVMTTPALVVDGKVKVAGRVPSVDEIKKMLG